MQHFFVLLGSRKQALSPYEAAQAVFPSLGPASTEVPESYEAAATTHHGVHPPAPFGLLVL